MIEIRPSVTHFASAAWGRNVATVAAATAAIVLALLGSTIGILIGIVLVASEASLALRFTRSRLRADSTVLIYVPLLGPAKRVPRSRLEQVEMGRTMTGIVGRSKRMVFAAPDGRPLVALDPAVWSPDAVGRIAAVMQLPVNEWREPRPRGALDHALRMTVAGAALVMIVATAVTIVVVIVLLRGA